MALKDPKKPPSFNRQLLIRYGIALGFIFAVALALRFIFDAFGLPDWIGRATGIAVFLPVLNFNPKDEASWSQICAKLLFKGFINLLWAIPLYWLAQWFYDEDFQSGQKQNPTFLLILLFGPVVFGIMMLAHLLLTPDDDGIARKPPPWAAMVLPIYMLLHTSLTLAIIVALFSLDASLALALFLFALGIFIPCAFLTAQDPSSLPPYPDKTLPTQPNDMAEMIRRINSAVPLLLMSSFYIAVIIHLGWLLGAWVYPVPANILNSVGIDAVWDFLFGLLAVIIGMAFAYFLSISLIAIYLLRLNLSVLPTQSFWSARRYAHEVLLEAGYKMVSFVQPGPNS